MQAENKETPQIETKTKNRVVELYLCQLTTEVVIV